MKRIRSFDLIRILATFFITVFHWNLYCIDMKIHTNTIFLLTFASGNIAYIGVSLFFILSGASLMYTYRRKIDIRQYFWKRFLSIYPQYWVSYTAIFVFLYVIMANPMVASKKTLLLSFLGMDGFLYYKIPGFYLIGEWFVGCIVLLYLLFPLLYWCVNHYPRATAVITILLYVPFLYFYPLEMDVTHFPLTRVPEVLIGMYFVKYCCSPDNPAEKPLRCSPVVGLTALAAFLAAYFIKIELPDPYLFIWIGSSCFLFLVWVFQYIEGVRSRLLDGLAGISRYTYSFFLIHHILMPNYLFRFQEKELSLAHNYCLFAFYLLTMGLLSVVLYHLAALLTRLLRRLTERQA